MTMVDGVCLNGGEYEWFQDQWWYRPEGWDGWLSAADELRRPVKRVRT